MIFSIRRADKNIEASPMAPAKIITQIIIDFMDSRLNDQINNIESSEPKPILTIRRCIHVLIIYVFGLGAVQLSFHQEVEVFLLFLF